MVTITGSPVSGQITANASTPTPLSTAKCSLIKGVTIKAMSTNGSDLVYIGGADVSATNGYELRANDSVFWPAANLENLYVISSSGSKKVCFGGA